MACDPVFIYEITNFAKLDGFWRPVFEKQNSVILTEGPFSIEGSHADGSGQTSMSISGTVIQGYMQGNLSNTMSYTVGGMFWLEGTLSIDLKVWTTIPPTKSVDYIHSAEGTLSMESTQNLFRVSANGSSPSGKFSEHDLNSVNETVDIDQLTEWTTGSGNSRVFDEHPGVTYYLSQHTSWSSSHLIAGDFNQNGSASISTNVSFGLTMAPTPMLPVPLISELTNTAYYGVGNLLRFSALDSYDPDDLACEAENLAYHWEIVNKETKEVVASGNDVILEHKFMEPGKFELFLNVIDDEGQESNTSIDLNIRLTYFTVVAHGWVPFESEVPITQEQTNKFAGEVDKEAKKLSVPHSTTITEPFYWNSHEDFGEALSYELASEGLSILSRTLARKLNPLALPAYTLSVLSSEMAKLHSQFSRWLATKAAEDLASFVSERAPARTDDKSFIINLIGHSRGGAVVALASQILESKHGITACGVTSLDGLGTDWPVIGDIADWIPNPNGGAKFRNNWRVQDGYAALGASSLASILSPAIRKLAEGYGLSSVVDYFSSEIGKTEFAESLVYALDAYDIKAPVRSSFNNNATVVDSPNRSNHGNVDNIYFARPDLMAESPLGEKYKACIGDEGGGSGEDEGDTKILLSHGVPLSPGVRQLIQLQTMLSELDSHTLIGDPWVQQMTKIMRSPAAMQDLLGRLARNAEAVPSQGVNAGGIKLSSSSSSASFYYRTFLTHEEPSLVASISYNSASIPSDAKLTVKINGTIAKEVSLAGVTKDRIVVDIPTDLRGAFEAELIVHSESKAPFSILLTDVGISSVMNTGRLAPVPTDVVFGFSAELVLTRTTASSSSPQATVKLFIESNGVAGLQEGVNGDRLTQTTTVQYERLLSVESSQLVAGENTVYAVVEAPGEPRLDLNATFSVTIPPPYFQNPLNPLDVDRDGSISPLDVLVVINHLNHETSNWPDTTTPRYEQYFLDVTGNDSVDPLDVLTIINYLNQSHGGGEGESVGSPEQAAWVTDQVFMLDPNDLFSDAEWHRRRISRRCQL